MLKGCIQGYLKAWVSFDNFELRDMELYYKGKSRPLLMRGKLRPIGTIADILHKGGLHNLGFHIPVDGKAMARQAVMLNRVREELPSPSDIAKANDIELQEIMENVKRSTENLI